MGWQDDPIVSATGGSPWERDPIAQQGPEQFGIDWSRPVAEVRAELAKLPEADRPEALKQWATDYVGKERAKQKEGDPTYSFSDFVRNVGRGAPVLGSWAGELNALTQSGLHKVTGGAAGAPYDETLAYNDAVDRAIDAEDPIGSAATQIGAGVASGAPLLGRLSGAAKTLPGKTAVLGPAVMAGAYARALGEGEGDFEQRHEYATSGEGKLGGLSPTELGAILGFGLPSAGAAVGKGIQVAADAASPLVARVDAQLRDLPKRVGILASADGSVPDGVGARAAAEQVIANQLARAGKSVEDLRREMAAGEYAGRFDANSRAQDVTALVDLDPSMQRLAGSAARASPEAGSTAKTFIEGRQTGETPTAGPVELAEAGIPTRPMMARPITGKQAERDLGSSFGAAQDSLVPMGQGERIGDAFKRALRIEDAKLHGHEKNAYRTDEAILDGMKAEAQPAYNALYKAGDNISVASEVGAALQKWLPDGDHLSRQPQEIRDAMRGFVRMFAPDGKPISHIETFDKTKRLLDDKIENFMTSMGDNKSKSLGALLTEFKADLLKAVDGVKRGGLGDLYRETRGKWSSGMESRQALQAGKDAWKQDSDIGIDAYRAVTSGKEGDEKLFRLGLWSGYEQVAKNMGDAADKTRLFAKPNIRELLSEVIPRSQKSTAEFANRPERFGQFIGGERKKVQTRDEVLGNSKTAERIKDDEAFDTMTRLGETFERFKSSGSMTMLGVRAVEHMLGKLFGMRADTAASVSRQLFTANPVERERILRAIEGRLGRNRAEQFSRLLEDYQRKLTAVGARQGAMPELPETE